MKKKYLPWILLLIVLACGLLYLNRSYAYIYQRIDQANLRSPDMKKTFTIGDNNNSEKTIIYAALGDSLTAGVGVDDYEQSYPYQLAKLMTGNNGNIILKDHSISGGKSLDLNNLLLTAAIKDNPDIVTVLIGVNDIHGNISQDIFKKNYEEMLKRLTKETQAKIYLINIPYLGADNLILPPYNYYFDAKTKEFNSIIKELASAYQADYIDLYSPTLDRFKKSGPHYCSDLFHPSAQGYAIWAEIIYDHLNK